MAGDDLNDPLGFRPVPAAPARALPWRALGLGTLGVVGAGIVTLAYVTDNGMGAEPFAVARIDKAPAPVAPPVPVAAAGAEATATIRPGQQRSTAGDLETESGVRVVRQGGGGAPGALIIHVPEEFGVQLIPAPDRRLVDKGRFGPLPKIGADGSRPSDVYARPLVTSSGLKPGAPRIAIVVGGMGLSQQATQAAAAKLPGAVTLAFAPYGADLEKQAARARESGHELLLQIPMEPYSAAESPGPHTLQTAAAPEQNLEDLHWLMSRFQGYAGMANFLGAKFMASETALSPVLREAASRGLIWLDDGSSSQSGSGSIAGGGRAQRADVVIDASPKPEAIEAALLKLETIARQKGGAIGFATGLPGTMDAIARFARGLEKRGIALVPLTSLTTGVAVPSAGIAR